MGEEKRSTASAIAEYAPVMISRPGTPKNVHHGCKTWRLVGVAALCSFLHMALWSSDQIFQAGWTLNWIPLSRNGDSHRTFQWSDIEPSQSLEYSSCHEHFLCARLLVPLNWNWTQAEKANGSRVAIAMIKLPAKVSISHPQYGGPVIINPGGPGESGINQVLSHGRDLQTILDSPAAPEAINKNATGKYFDVLSFDPRGVNNTTPELHCFPDVASQASWRLTSPVFGTSWDSEVMIGLEMARATALGASCSRQFEGEGILRYANTAQVVEDMVEIIEKDGEWRAREAGRLNARSLALIAKNVQSGLRNSAYLPGHEKLQYWGKSYGTIIGSTFAAMHPDRVGRIVLDGVVDPADHYAGNWLTQLQDSDKIITQFSRRCHQAGPHKCRLYLNTSPEDIEKRFTAILETLKMNPIPVTSTTGGENWAGPQIVTYGDVHLYLLSGMYFPFAMAEQLFDLAYAIETRNMSSPSIGKLLASKQSKLADHESERPDSPTTASNMETRIPYISMMGPFQTISCMDTNNTSSKLTLPEFNHYLGILQDQSHWISPSWARNKFACLGHTSTPAYRPNLSFVHREWENTSHPILLIGNSNDPVTPIGNAQRVEGLFPGGVMVRQESEGHCSHAMPSLCTGKVVREYFQTGKLPSRNTLCETEWRPFVGCANEEGCTFEKEDGRLWDALKALADPFGLSKR